MILLHRICAGVFLIGWLGVTSLRAHEAGLSVTEVRVHHDSLELTASFALADIQRMLPPSVRLEADTSQGTLDSAQAALGELGALLYDVRENEVPLVPRDMHFEFTPSDNLAFRYTYSRPATGRLLFRSLNLASLPSTHRELFTVVDEMGRTRVSHALTARDNTAAVSLAEIANDPVPAVAGAKEETSASTHRTFVDFFKLGVEHIWTGYDHLLFLFGLLLVCRSFRSIVVIITCFTLAHSFTLGLATLNLVQLSPTLVEPLIAGSIVFVGLENLLWRGAEPRGRGWLTFGFGLIHGFGFSSVLRDLGVGAHGDGIVLPLLSFNLGVEFGQVCVALLILPLLARAFRSDKVRHYGVPAASVVVASAGLYWLIERTLLS